MALMAAGADRLDVADHLMLGAERGDEQAVAWLRDAAREASARAPSVSVELIRRAEALLPDGHPDADRVAAEVVQALLRAGKVAEASARAEAVLARPHAPEVDTPLRLALLGALALQNRAAELIALAETSLAGVDPAAARRAGADARPAELGADVLGRPARGRIGRRPGARDRRAGERCGDDGVGADGVAGGGGTAGPLRRGAGRTRGGPPPWPPGRTTRDRCRCSRSSSSGWRCSTATSSARRGSRTGRRSTASSARGGGSPRRSWRTRRRRSSSGSGRTRSPGLIAGGQAAEEKGNQLLVSQSLAYRTIIATGTGDHRAASELAAPIADVAGRRRAELQRGDPRVRGGGAQGGRGRPAGAPTTCCCGAGGSTPRGRTASTTAGLLPISCAWPWRSAIATSPPRWPAPSRRASPWRRRCRRCAAWRCAARDWSTARSSR